MFWNCTVERVDPVQSKRGVRYVRRRERIAWPDGGSLMAQETCVVDVFEIMLDECNRSLARGG